MSVGAVSWSPAIFRRVNRIAHAIENFAAGAIGHEFGVRPAGLTNAVSSTRDRKSTRLNSSHGYISYAVFCLKKKKQESAVIKNVLSSHDRLTLHRYL